MGITGIIGIIIIITCIIATITDITDNTVEQVLGPRVGDAFNQAVVYRPARIQGASGRPRCCRHAHRRVVTMKLAGQSTHADFSDADKGPLDARSRPRIWRKIVRRPSGFLLSCKAQERSRRLPICRNGRGNLRHSRMAHSTWSNWFLGLTAWSWSRVATPPCWDYGPSGCVQVLIHA